MIISVLAGLFISLILTLVIVVSAKNYENRNKKSIGYGYNYPKIDETYRLKTKSMLK